MPQTATKTATTSSLERVSDYAARVLSGEIVAGPHVRNACRRHFDDLEHGEARGLWFDEEACAHGFRFFEEGLSLSEGQFDGAPFILAPSQAFIIGSCLGWMRADGTRRFRRAYIEMGKGNGKSPMAGGFGLYGLTADDEAGSQVYSAAAHRDQAAILFRDAVAMVKKSKPLAKRLRFSGGEGREYNIADHRTGSFFRPTSRDTGKTGSGPRPYFVLADEVHELPDGKILEMLERGFKFRRQPFLLMITNSGSDRNSICWAEHEWAVKVAAGSREAVTDFTYVGEPIGDDTFSYVCALDEGDDPLRDPSCWPKANPLLGVTITEEYLAGVVQQARDIPAKQNGILRLHFCVWTDADSAWLSREALEPCIADFDPAEHKGKHLFMGMDLSQNRDLTAVGIAVKTGEVDGKPTFDMWAEVWTPADTAPSRELRDKLPYGLWIKQGHIHAPPGENIQFRHVAQTLVEYHQDYAVDLLAYDRYAFKKFEEEAKEVGLSANYVEHPQGGTKKGKPTEEMQRQAKASGKEAEGLWFPSSLRQFEDAIAEKRVRIRRNPVVISAIMSAVTEADKWENRWLSKAKSYNRIDPAVALVMAFGAANALNSQKKPMVLRMLG